MLNERSRGASSAARALLLGAVVLALPLVSAADERLPRVASINVCTDQLLIELADAAQIVSLSPLALDPASSHHHESAHRWPANDGHAESVLRGSPDLVFAGAWDDGYTLRLLERAGVRVERLPVADSIEAVIENLRRVGTRVGQPGRATARIAAMRDTLAAVADAPAPGAPPLAAIYDPNGYSAGPATLRGEQIALAGYRNAAELADIERYGALPLESLVGLDPDVLIDSPFSDGTFSRAQRLTQHPALRARPGAPRVIGVPSRDTLCGGPWSAEVVRRLAQARDAH